MKLKRIIASILAASVISTGAYAFTPYLPEEEETEASTGAQEDMAAGEEKEESGAASGIVGLKPKDYEYRIFLQVLEAYAENHLYDFTKEEALYKFFSDFLSENPSYIGLFLDYLLGTMDPYSGFYEASSGFLETNSESKGFGLIIKNGEDGVYVDSVIEDSSAKDAGFMPGDKFVSVAGINIENQSYDIVTAVLARSAKFIPKNTEAEANTEESTTTAEEKDERIEFVIDRNGERITLRAAKGPMYLSQISSSVDQNNGKPTAYIQVSSFLGDNTDTEFVELVKKYAEDGIKHLTIDLRDNGGGSLDYALAMAEAFIEKDDIICYFKDRNVEKPTPIYSTTEKFSFDSITILVNENTVSAAELFTSILRDKGLAKVIGKKTYGKSLGQSVYTLATGDYFTITTYQMLDTSLESYDGKGLFPDITIDDVEMSYTLPPLGIFNHTNALEIKEGEYSDVTKALEDRMVIMGLLREKYADGIFDEITKTALYIFQTDHGIEATGLVTYDTVSKITKLINSYKTKTYFDNAQYEVAMIVHHSLSQGKRLAKEKEKLREEQAAIIIQKEEAYDASNNAQKPVTENN